MGGKKLNTESFIEAAIALHGDQFDYSLVEYKGTRTDVKIICKVHGVFLKKPDRHLKGVGCQKCGRYTTKQFVEKSKEIHGEKYDYSLVIYTGTRNKIKIICPVHGEFLQDPTVHLRGHGCRKCHHHTLRDFIKRGNIAHEGKYDYSKSVFLGWRSSITITCPVHGDFEQIAWDHIRPYGCSKCGDKGKSIANRMPVVEFISRSVEAHNTRYDYNNVAYTNIYEKVNIICPLHGEFEASPTNHMRGNDKCPMCFPSTNGGVQQSQVVDFLKSIGQEPEINDRKLIKPFEIDIVCGEIAFEFNGLWCHSAKYKENIYHMNKTKLCNEKGVRLIHIWEDDWKNKSSIVKSFISSLFVKGDTVFARNTKLVHLDIGVANNFFKKNHIQGSPFSASYYVGLMHKGELVSVCSFKHSQYGFELTRCCNLSGLRVIGSLGKYISWVKKSKVSKSIYTFCDLSMFNGDSYKSVGFSLDSILKPDYKYIVSNTRKHKSGFRRKYLPAILGEKFDESISEIKNMENNGFYRIYDCGKAKYVIDV